MTAKIMFENKEALQNDENIERKNKVTDEDMNEIKKVVNQNADDLTELENTFETVTSSALQYKGTVTTYIDLELIENPLQGDIYTVLDENKNYAYNGEIWFFYNNVEEGYVLKKDIKTNSVTQKIDSVIPANINYIIPLKFQVKNNSLEIFYCGEKLASGQEYIEIGEAGSISNTIQFKSVLGDLDMSEIEGFENFKETLEFIVKGDYNAT